MLACAQICPFHRISTFAFEHSNKKASRGCLMIATFIRMTAHAAPLE